MSRVAIVYPRADLDSVPSLVAAVEALAEAGFDVEVLTIMRAGQAAPVFASPRVRLRSLGRDGQADLDTATAGLRRVVRQVGWLRGAARGPLAHGYRVLGSGLASGSRMVARARGARRPLDEPYQCVIGVDPDGLEAAHAIARGAPLGYYSLELLLSYELGTPVEQQLKVRERELSRQAWFVIVQDEARARLLAEDNGLLDRQVILVPNAPPGPARRAPSGYWHQRFDLPASERVVLHSGSLGEWTGIDDIVESTRGWPPGWTLVVHTRYDAEASEYVDRLRRRADPQRVRFSLRPVPRQDYDALIDGADIGLAFYVSSAASSFTQRNVQTIGLSSGKLAYYLRAGLPVIVNRAASVADTIEASGCGLAVDSAVDIGAALARLGDQYADASAAACRFFVEHLDFRRAFDRVIERLGQRQGVVLD